MSNQSNQIAGNGPSNSNMSNPMQPGAAAPQGQSQNMSSQHLNQIVIEYLTKKGYRRTEQILRLESENVDKDGRPLPFTGEKTEAKGPQKYAVAFRLINSWVDQNLDIYKFELKRILWPVFVYSYLELVADGFSIDAKDFMTSFRNQFERIHSDELRVLDTVTLPAHVSSNATAKLYRGTKYRLPLTTHIYYTLITFLEQHADQGGSVITFILQTYCEVRETSRGPMDQYSFEAIISRAHAGSMGNELGDAEELEEGIPGGFTGVSNKDIMNNNAPLRLGPLQSEPELIQDVRAELEDEDSKNPPEPGQESLVEAYDRKIKREDSPDAVPRNEVPLPPSRARDVLMEVQKMKEQRDRFKIDSRTGGIGPGVSVCMFTFHNTLDSVNCIEFSDDTNLVAVGTEESYIRVWNLHGEPLTSIIPRGPNDPEPTSSRRLVGHAGPVYNVSFSPSIAGPDNAGSDTPSTAPKLLLSGSADRTIRLWSLEAWTCLVVYKGHEGPVFNVRWGPFGHYFASCGRDKTARIWAQDRISYLRMMVGHDTSVNQVAWHPNGAYVFTASDNEDKTVRMWSITNGACVRVFPGHNEFIGALECSPNGKMLASADNGGTIILWDLAKGTQIKRCRGHGKGGIYSLSWSVESTVLTSGGADGTVRVWDVNVPPDPYKNEGEVIGSTAQADATRMSGSTGAQQGSSAGTSSAVVGGGKKKGKEMVITPDQISAFPTKKSPVYNVKFTRMNLVMAGGCYMP